MRRLLPLVAALAAGCFSGDDFSDCTGPGQCGVDGNGRGMLCSSGVCVTPAVSADDPDAIRLSGPRDALQPHPDRTVVIDAIELSSQFLKVDADVIIIQGSIDGQGRGFKGGAPGSGGAIGSNGTDGEIGAPNRENRVDAGEGGDGGIANGGDGAPGMPGTFAETEPCRIAFTTTQAGSSGGGGGGAAGGACLGSDGGEGGAGGGAILLRASRFIEVRGTIDARGADGEPGASANCPDGAVGGAGGGGSGGLIYLEAPTVLFGEGARLDVSGGDGATGGLVTIFGVIEGRYVEPIGVGPSSVCLSP